MPQAPRSQGFRRIPRSRSCDLSHFVAAVLICGANTASRECEPCIRVIWMYLEQRMDQLSISCCVIRSAWDRAAVPVLLDVRPPAAFQESETMTIGAQRPSPEALERWAPLLPQAWAIVVHYVRGGSISRGVVRSFESKEMPGKYLLATSERSAKNSSQHGASETLTRWITREQSKVDRKRAHRSIGRAPISQNWWAARRMSFE